jgi:dual specificity tyrosine-phosphorylation-regulated kinase 2/3/4
LRPKASIADESGGEEILYPRNPNTTLYESTRVTIEQGSSTDDTPRVARHATDKTLAPSSFSQHTRSARKRNSDEFEFDQTGSLISKYASSSSSSAKDKTKEEKLATARRHRSLNSGSVSSRDGKTRERQRESTGLSLNILNPSTYIHSPDRHTRQTSTGSTSSSLEPGHSRRAQASDFSYLPPSPSSNSIQHLLRSPNNAANTAPPASTNSQSLHPSSKDNLHAHPSSNVAHSLVSGTQAGWSSLDDEAAAAVLRKLDGLSGKGARARASVASFGRPSSSSRPTTPARQGNQVDASASDSAKSKHGSKDTGSGKDVPRGGGGHIPVDNSAIATSSDDQLVHVVPQEKTPKKSTGIKLSFTPKRGSTSSTTYTSTPSSRDSASMSATTSVTSMSATSGRHSSNKARRNSAGSDISSVHSSEALRDRVASIALNGDATDDAEVPPVPPLPKDLSNYRSPPSTSAGYAFPTVSSDEKDKTLRNDPSSSRSISLDVPPSPIISPPAPSSGRRDSQHYSSVSGNDSVPAVRTPSKKWSFSNALNKLGSPSSSSQKSGFPLSPRAAFGQQLRKSSSKDQQMHAFQWSPNQPAATASVHSLASLSSLTSATSPTQSNNTRTPDRTHASSSRPGTGSSVSTNNTTSALSAAPNGPVNPAASVRRTHSKRLTPSSIPFFSRRSSSQSMQLPPPPIQFSSSISPTVPSTSFLSAQTPRKQSNSPAQDYNVISISTSTPGTTQKKSSMLSLGLPSLLKSSSRRSLHSDAKDSDKEGQKAKAAAKEAEKSKNKLEKQKKEDKDRSESRISVIINRKRGKVCSCRYN